MLHALDHTATDALGRFHGALQLAQDALHAEESRLSALLQSVKSSTASNAARRTSAGTPQSHRLDALRAETRRVRSAVDAQRQMLDASTRQLDAARRPREEAEAQCVAERSAALLARRAYVEQSAALHAEWAKWWRADLSLGEMQRETARHEAEAQRLQEETNALRAKLRRQAEAETASGGDGAEAETLDGSEKAFGELERERSEWEREAATSITARRAEREALRAELRRLCVVVEAADTAQQAAQQALHDTLNRECDARAVCKGCGRNIADSFLAS